jgi:hypothetical protein
MFSRVDCWNQVRQWAMMYLQTVIELNERDRGLPELNCLLRLYENQISKRRKMIAIYLIFYFLQVEVELLTNSPRLRAVLERKCREFTQEGLYVGHFIGIPQTQSTFWISQIPLVPHGLET